MASRKQKGSKRKSAVGSAGLRRSAPEPGEGRYFDLPEMFKRLNAKYFQNRLPPYRVIWGQRRRQRPKNYFVFATIREDERVIRVHPALDASFVPEWFMEYILFHEMLHAVVPEEYDSAGRRRVHTELFKAREAEFPLYEQARKWEAENLDRFLR